MMLEALSILTALAGSPIVNQDDFGRFLSKGASLRQDSLAQLRVYQIGDSHLQAGFFGGRLRDRFQKVFGGAGRGLAFPHRTAGSNGAFELRWGTSDGWSASNAIRREPTFVWGMAGWSLQTKANEAKLDFRLAPSEGVIDSFAQVTVLGEFEGIEIFDSTLGWTKRDSSKVSFTASRPMRSDRFQLRLRGEKARLDGLVLQSARPGILWNDAGVNGMSWSDLLKPSLLWKQLHSLGPDLVVVSLGTNDAWYAKYDEATFRTTAKEVLHRVRLVAPGTSVLLTLPPDHALKVGRRKTAPNPRLTSVIKVLRELCESGDATCVDLQELMGGEGSWKEWTANGLMAKDHVHYAKAGYIRHADLVADALLALPATEPSAELNAGSVKYQTMDPQETQQFLATQDSLIAATTWAEPKQPAASPETASKVVEKKTDSKPKAVKKPSDKSKSVKKKKTTKDRKIAKKKVPKKKVVVKKKIVKRTGKKN
jgi:hypothetical protein